MSTADLDVGVEKLSIDTRPFCGLATLSLIFGILSFVALPVIGGFLAVVFGHKAHVRIRESYHRLRGETTAKAGMALGFANLVLAALVFLFLLTSLYAWRSREATATTHFVLSSPAPPASPSSPPLTPGVKMANEMGRADFDLVQKLNLASEADPVICVYNATSNYYEPEMAVLTGKRITYVKEGRITPMDLSEIETILDHRKYMEKYQMSGYVGDQFNIEIKGKNGTRMRIVVKPGMDGPSFYEALNDAWKAVEAAKTTEAELHAP